MLLGGRGGHVALVLGLALLTLLIWRLWQQNLGQPDGPPGSVSRYVTRSANVMATRIDVTLPRAQSRLSAHVFEIFRSVDKQMSEWKPTSPLAAVNRFAGESAQPVPSELFSLIERGLRLSRETGGAFDLTWAALWGLWDFRAERPQVPKAAEIERRAALVDYRLVQLDERAKTVYLPRRGMKIGLGAIAKGHALARSAEALRRAGGGSFMISAGGQVLVAGQRGSRPWRVGIRDPRAGRERYVAVLELVDTSVSTSGDYERFFEYRGVRYHHILDPRSGMPSRGLRSATVVSRDAPLADALSTAVMVLGLKRGLALIERRSNVEAVLIDQFGQLHATAGALQLLRR
jgi:thiamine biosynthesis lipoprotein